MTLTHMLLGTSSKHLFVLTLMFKPYVKILLNYQPFHFGGGGKGRENWWQLGMLACNSSTELGQENHRLRAGAVWWQHNNLSLIS